MMDRFVDITVFMLWVYELKKECPSVFELMFDEILKSIEEAK
jgi:hypothetical protein